MNRTLRILEATPLFNGLPEGQLMDVGRICVTRRFSKGEWIFSEGQRADGFYIVAAGQVKIYKVSPEGKEKILHIFGPGQPFGEVPVFTGRRFPASAEALAASRLLFFPRGAFVALIEAHPSLALNMLAVLSRRLREFTVQIEYLSLKEVPARLAAYLMFLGAQQEDGDAVELPISKGQLASILGTIPETLSRIFARMSTQGLLQVQGREIRLMDRNGLEELAAAERRLDRGGT